MRIALVCPYDLGKPGGVQDQVFRLRRWMSAAGHDAVIVGPGDVEGTDVIGVGGTVTVPANQSATPVALDPRVASRVRAAVEGAEVVHIHEPLMPVVALAATRIGTSPTVGTFHADAPRWIRRALRLGSPITRAATSRLDVVTAVSEVARSAVTQLEPVRVIPNGIDVADYGGHEKDPHLMAFVGRDDPRKGLDVLLGAWPIITAAHPHARLQVVGAQRTDAPPGVEYLGRVSEEDKRRVLATASIAVMPNTGGESFGIVVAEAMASGCAVVASALPAFIAVLGAAGELFAPRDVEGLAEGVISLLDAPDRMAALGATARAEVRRFDGATVAAEYLEAYDEAIRLHR
jgi:phosphatidylinositol alpha-mannosyltransferase